MGILDNLRGMFIEQPQQTKQAPMVVYQGVGSYSQSKQSYTDIAKEGYQENAIVYRCVNEIATGAAAIPFKVYEGDAQLDMHPLVSLLKRPNPQMAGVEYFSGLYSYLLLSGNSYAVRNVINQNNVELHLLRPDRVKVEAGQTTIPIAYNYMIGGRLVQSYDVDQETGQSDIKHFKMWSPLDDHYGMSPVSAAAVDIDQHNLAARHNVNLLNNGARPSGAVVFKPRDESGMTVQLTEAQRQQVMHDLNSRFAGTDNAGRPMLLEGDFEWKEMGLSPKDMDFLELKNMSARDIALCFGVPSQLVGVPDAQTYANVQEARLALYEETIIPLARKVESDLNEWITPIYGDNFRVEYDIDAIPAMAERRRRIYDNVINAVREGILSRNEARDRLGYEPIEGGDDVYITANLFPLGAPAVADSEGTPEDDGKLAYGLVDDSKRAIRRDVFTTEEEASERAEEIGCDGIHSHTDNGVTVYMPCASHDDYERLTGDTLKQDPRMGEGRDVFETQPEAEARARKLGCDGTHTVKGPDGNFYMPCSSHAIYLRVTGQEKELYDVSEQAKAESDVDTKPTQAMSDNAARGLRLRREHNRGGTEVGVARAVQLQNRENLSPRTVRRMHSFFSRHEAYKPNHTPDSASFISWLLWGGDEGQAWAKRKVDELEKAKGKQIELELEMSGCGCGGCTPEESKAEVSSKIKKAIENKIKEHNDKHGDKKGKRVTQRMLEAVFRRGVGAYRTNPESVRRNVMGPDQWGLARVNAFLHAVRTGKFRSGKFDRDLLPTGHPLKSDKEK